MPAKAIGRRDDRGGCRRRLGLPRNRIRLLRDARATRADDVVFVARPRADARHEQFPHAGRVAHAHRMAPGIPGIEIADDCDPPRIGCPYRKTHARYAIDRHRLGAECAGKLEVTPLVEQMQVELAEKRAECIRVLSVLHAARPRDPQQIGLGVRHQALE